MEGCDRGVIGCDETNFLMEGSRRKEPRRGSESMVDEMLFKSWPRNYWKEVKYLSSFGMLNTISLSKSKKTVTTRQTFSTASRTPFLLAAENKAAAYLP